MRRFSVVLLVALSLLFVFAAPAFAQQVKNVAVSRVEPGQATVVVKTDIPSDITIDYGEAPGDYTMNSSSTGSLRHEVLLTGLSDSSRIYYRVTITDSAVPANTQTYPESSFSTFKAAGLPFSFTVAGDNRPAPNNPVLPTSNWITIIAQMAAENIDLSLHAGDIIMAEVTDTASNNELKYDSYFAVTKDLTRTVPYYMAAGNHERIFEAVGMDGYLREFTLPQNNGADAAAHGELYYSFDHGDTHFIFLCTELPGQYGRVIGNQKAWLINDLAANTRPWTVVVLHQPLYGHSGSASHANDPWANPNNAAGQQNRAEIVGLFEQYGVDVVFQGHDHYYLRHVENGIQYVVTGGGGSPLYPLPSLGPGDMMAARAFHHVKVDETATSMKVSAVDTSGAALESFTLGTPALGLATTRIYWNSMADYQARELSVDYELDSRGAGDALAVELLYGETTNGVFLLTSMPQQIGVVPAGQSASLTLKYLVPFGVSSFRATTYAACDSHGGDHYNFPGPPPGI